MCEKIAQKSTKPSENICLHRENKCTNDIYKRSFHAVILEYFIQIQLESFLYPTDLLGYFQIPDKQNKLREFVCESDLREKYRNNHFLYLSFCRLV